MSFLSAVGHFFAGAGKVAAAADPYLQVASRLPIGGPFGTIVNSVIQVEQLVGELGGKGSDKKAAVTQLVTLAYPNIDKAALSQAIDGIVKILNDLTKATTTANP